ncbi:MAG TPA: methyltransferase domain-containing protein [Vicinamibacteria bacterium]|jgi:trans-aconitate 2-methyltransferase|nr:methyltransferase domain-containing protein [Vicinamibacteria bacterium]
MAEDAWDPRQYNRFHEERSQPFFDLLNLVRPQPGMRVVDLGCGTGELTRRLHRHLGARETLGIDSSAAMLAESRAHAADGLRFEKNEILQFAAARTGEAPWDLIFSNAALHWVPEHDHLLRSLASLLAPGGQLAIQVPANHDHLSQTVAAQVAGEAPFREALGGYVRRSPVLPPEEYALSLDRLAYQEQQVRLQVYGHRLKSREEVVEWTKGTLLTDYQQRLSPDLFSLFQERYRERLLPALADSRPYFLPYKRILLWAKR